MIERLKPPHRDPHYPPDWTPLHVYSVRAFAEGNASPEQQRRVWEWLMYVSGIHDVAYRPGGEDGERATAFALGKQFVGQQFLKMLADEMTEAIEERRQTANDQKR